MFDIEKFDSASFTFPTKKIPVSELKEFFQDGCEAVWEIKGLSGHEVAIANEAVETMSKKKAILEALADGSNDAIKKSIKTLLNQNQEVTPEDYARRLKMLELSSVNPKCPEHICVKIAHYKPSTFYMLTNRIIQLVGDGATLGE